jgi:hypothetical protein
VSRLQSLELGERARNGSGTTDTDHGTNASQVAGIARAEMLGQGDVLHDVQDADGGLVFVHRVGTDGVVSAQRLVLRELNFRQARARRQMGPQMNRAQLTIERGDLRRPRATKSIGRAAIRIVST